MTRFITAATVLTLLAAGASLQGCGGSDDSSPRTGRISVSVTDAPVDHAAGLFLTLKSVTLQGVEGTADQGPIPVPEAHQLVNLMEFTGAQSAVLISDIAVPPGTYKLRLDADLTFTETEQQSWIAFDKGAPECETLADGAVWSQDGETCRYPLDIPSGEQSGFKPKGDVTVTAGGTSAFTVEFDLRKNVVDPQGANDIAYVLKPTGLRLVNDAAVGTITGTLDPSLFGQDCAAADARVYLYDRAGQAGTFVPDDMHPANTSLVTSVPVLQEPVGQSTTYRYLIGFVPAGTYGLALTCESSDDPEVDEDLEFVAQADGVVVTAGASTVQNLSAVP